MRPKSFYLLLFLTLLAAGVALVLLLLAPQAERRAAGEGPAFPLLAAAPEEAAEIEVAAPEGGYRLTRSSVPGLWLLPEKGGYPADRQAVAALLSGLAGLRLHEAKTARTEHLPLLDLAPGEGEALQVVIRDAAGDPLVDAVIGRSVANVEGSGTAGTYLRYGDQPQAWLALGEAAVPAGVGRLYDPALVNLPGNAVARISVRPPDAGAPLMVERDGRGGALSLVPPPREDQRVDEPALRQLADSLAGLTFMDVRPADRFAFEAPWRAVFTSFDGIRVVLALALVEGEPWMTLTAEAAPPVGAAADAAPRADVRAFATKLEAAADGWAYRISPLVFQRLTPTRETLLVPAAD